MAAQQVGSLYLEVFLDPTQYYAQIQAVEKRAREMATRIEREWKQAPLSPRVDDRELTDLNRHLDLKRRHYSEVRNDFERNPIKLKVDDRELSKIKVSTRTETKVVNVKVNNSGAVGNIAPIPLSVNVDTSGIIKELNNLQSQIAKQSSTSLFGNLLMAPLKLAAGSIGKIIEGVVFGATASIGQEIGQGIKDGITKESAGIIGSFEFISRKIAENLSAAIVDSLEEDVGKLKEIVKIVSNTSDIDIAIESRASQAKIKGREQQKRNAGIQAISNQREFVSENMGVFSQRRASLVERRNELAQNYQKISDAMNRTMQKMGAEQLQQEANELSKSVEQNLQLLISPSGDTNFEEINKSNRELQNKLDKLTDKLNNISETVKFRYQEFIDVLDKEAKSLDTDERRLINELAPLTEFENLQKQGIKSSVKSKKKVNNVSNQPEIYKQVFDEVVKASGFKGNARIPELVVNPDLSQATLGKYNPEQNQIQLTPQAYQQVLSGDVKQVSGKFFEILVHELRHAAQFSFGDTDAFVQAPEIKLTKASPEEIAKLGGRVELSTATTKGVSQRKVRELETDAYIFAERNSEKIRARVMASNFQEQVGVGGGKIQNLIKIEAAQSQATLKKVQQLAEADGVDITKELESTRAAINAISKSVEPLLQKAASVEFLPVEEIEQLNQDLLAAYTSATTQIQAEIAQVKKMTFAKISEKRAQPQVSQEEFKQGLDTQYTAQGLRQVVKRLGTVNYNTKKKDELIEIIAQANNQKVEEVLKSLGDSIKKQPFKTSTQAPVIANIQTESFKNANKAIQGKLRELKTATESGRKQIIESLVIDLNKQLNEIDKVTSSSNVTGKKAQQLAGFRTYFEQVRQSVAGEFINNNNRNLVVGSNQNRVNINSNSPGLAGFDDIDAFLKNLVNNTGASKTSEQVIKEIVNKFEELAAKFDLSESRFKQLEEAINQRYESLKNGTARVKGFSQNQRRQAMNSKGVQSDPEARFYANSANFQQASNNFSQAEAAINNRFFAAIGGNASPIPPRIDNIKKSIHSLAESFKNIPQPVKTAVEAFSGLFVLSNLIPLLQNFAKESLDVAAKMEGLEKRIAFASGSNTLGAEQVQRLRGQADRLGLNQMSVLDAGANFLAASRGTPVEGEESVKGLEALNQASRVYNLTLGEQQRAQVALQQIVGKGIVSQEELRGQLSEALPGAAQTAARAYGVTTQELNRMIKGGLDSIDFFRKFTQQLGIESSGGVAGALETTQAAAAKFDASLLKLQESFGKMLLPIQKIGLDVLSGGIDLLTKSIPVLIALISAFAAKTAILSSITLVELIKNLVTSRAAVFALGASLKTTTGLVVAGLQQFLAFGGIALLINDLINRFRDLSGELRTQIDSVKSLQSEYKTLIDTANKLKLPDPKNNLDTFKQRSFVQIRSIATGEMKAVEDSIKAIKESSKITKEVLSTAGGNEVSQSVDQLKQLESQIESLQTQKRALAFKDPGNKEAMRNLNEQERALLTQRNSSTLVPDNIRKQLHSQAEAVKTQIEYVEKLKKEFPLYSNEIESANETIKQLKKDYDGLVSAQEKLVKSINTGADAFALMQRNIKLVADELSDINDKNQITTNTTKEKLAQQVTSGKLSPQQESLASQQLGIKSTREQAQLLAGTIQQIQALLNTPQNAERMRAFGVNENTGRARLSTLAEQSTNTQDKFLFEQLGALQQQKIDLSGLRLQLAEAQKEAQQRLVDLTKQVADYYRGIERNAQQQTIEIQRASKQVQVTQQQNKLRSALLDGYDTIVSQFIDSIIDSIGQFNQVGDRALEAQSQLLNNRFNLEDTLRSGVELSRNLPTVPIKLDFSGIPADNNIVELGRQVQEAIDGSNDLGESINGATSNADDLYKQLIENLKPLDDANKNLTDTASNFDSVNQKAQESGELAKQLGGELGAIPSQVANIDQGFVGIVASLGTIIAKTVEWLTNLGGAKESIEGIANNMGKHPFVQGIQQIGQGILQAGSYGIASPSTTQSLEQVLKGSVSQGQGFFGQRARGNHASIDFDGTEGLGGGAAFQAMFPGRVASTRAWGNGYRDVDGGNSNAIRIISKLPGGLGEFSTDYGHYKASTAKVQEGQDILAGTKLGVLSQKDSISSGGHLDLKIRIPSTIANQFKTAQSAGGGQSFVEVKEFMRWYQGQLGNASKQQTLPMTGASNIQSSAPLGGISRGGNPLSPAELARLTKEGQQLYQLQRNPNILAFADVVARAEGTDFRNNSKNFGYSMMIGGEHDADFSRHPFAGNSGSRIRAPRHNSTASGRYQMMDFNYSRTQAERQFGRGAKSDLASVFQGENPGSFSPGVQDLYFTASLKSRGILDEVLAGNFEAALKNPNIAKHYASLQSGAGRSAYKGQGTPEGQLKNTIPFAQQRLIARRREGAPVFVAADNFSAATPGQMRNGVLQGMNLAVQTAQQGGQRETLITKQSEADQERARQEAVRKASQALRQYERARRDQEDRSITNQRGVTDFGISAIKNPSPAQRRLQESTQIKRQSDDLIKEREREIENRQKQIEQSQEILRNKSYLAAPNAAEVETQLKQGIKENEKEIPRLAKQIDEIKKIGADYQKNVEAIFAREDNQRRQTADFEAFQGEIAKAQKQLEGLQQLQQVSPLDERVVDIPALQEEIELKQAALDLDKAIFDEENKLYSHSINQQEYDRRIEQIKQENIVRQGNAMARRQQAEAEQELQKVQRQLEVRAQATSMNNEYLQNMMQLRQLGKGGRNPLDIQREMNLAQMDSDFAQREFEINRNRNRTPEERERELESLRQIRQSRTDVINAELARNQEDNQIAARDLFNKSNLDVVGAQASNMRVFGQDNRARQLEKGMAVFQQQTAFQDQIRELERLAQTNEEVAKSADLIRANYEELNKIKLDEIENQFNEFLPAIQEIKGATQGLFSDLLSGADDAFANFGKKILDYFTQLAAQMLTNDLFGAIGGAFGMKGQQASGGGGQIFDLLGGLLGGLFYNGGYVPNYAKGYNPLQDALKREHAQTGKRAYVAVLSEGERVLNIDETRKFHAMGGDNILRFADGGMVGATSSFSPGNGGNVSVNNNIVIGGNAENTDVGAFRTVLDGRIREIIREEQRPGRSLNRKRR